MKRFPKPIKWDMSIIVHVIKPSGIRHQFSFPDGTSDEKIMSSLEKQKRFFGFQKRVRGKDPRTGILTEFEDQTSGFVFDLPDTVVAIGDVNERNEFVETRVIKGPLLAEPLE